MYAKCSEKNPSLALGSPVWRICKKLVFELNLIASSSFPFKFCSCWFKTIFFWIRILNGLLANQNQQILKRILTVSIKHLIYIHYMYITKLLLRLKRTKGKTLERSISVCLFPIYQADSFLFCFFKFKTEIILRVCSFLPKKPKRHLNQRLSKYGRSEYFQSFSSSIFLFFFLIHHLGEFLLLIWFKK